MDNKLDERWFTFGPFNPADGEYYPKFSSNVFKIICDGIGGDDGNLYRYALSRRADANVPIEGANALPMSIPSGCGTTMTHHSSPISILILTADAFTYSRETLTGTRDGDFIVVSVEPKGQVMPLLRQKTTGLNHGCLFLRQR
ncbi:MAG: hypothetical protein U5L72_07210 [Bacteroidales bacterium]|nr:hypothetical protein [Bacteroidales bacterium]